MKLVRQHHLLLIHPGQTFSRSTPRDIAEILPMSRDTSVHQIPLRVARRTIQRRSDDIDLSGGDVRPVDRDVVLWGNMLPVCAKEVEVRRELRNFIVVVAVCVYVRKRKGQSDWRDRSGLERAYVTR